MLARPLDHGVLADPLRQVASDRIVTPALISDVMARASVPPATLNSAAAARLRRLIEAEAWTDAALALIELALPQWQVVRLVHDGGEWCCALSQHPQMPDWLDDAVEATHEVLPLAILDAFVAARQTSLVATRGKGGTVPQCRPGQPSVLHTLCCEDFA
jgi:hypothetical protein